MNKKSQNILAGLLLAFVGVVFFVLIIKSQHHLSNTSEDEKQQEDFNQLSSFSGDQMDKSKSTKPE